MALEELVKVEIPKYEYEYLIERDRILKILEEAGVENWEMYDYAMTLV